MEMNNAVLVYSKSVSNNSKTEPELSQLVKVLICLWTACFFFLDTQAKSTETMIFFRSTEQGV